MSADERYKARMQDVLGMIERAYLSSSKPAPHPVWWKRLLRRPYRAIDRQRFLIEIQARHSERRVRRGLR